MAQSEKISISLESEELEAIEKIVQLCVEFLAKNRDRNEPVVRFRTPEELKTLINFPIPKQGTGLKGIIPEIETALKYCVRTGHVRFYNQLWAGFNLAAVLGEWLTAVTNGSMYTFEVAPVFSIMEVELLAKIRGLIGWKEGDGAFAPGGAHCNLLAILAARNRAFPDVRRQGIRGQPVAFTSVHDHYTVVRAVGVLGIGEENCIKVAVDERGHMIPEELEKAILKAKSEGKTPFFINATCGTTVLGAYDDLEEIAAIAKKYSIWAHVDACWGGHCLLSNKYRHLMKGCEQFDSIAWTATKCLGLPQQCAALVLKEKNVLNKCNAMGKDYLFHEHQEKEWDLGEKTLNCGRRNDVLKLWIAWKVAGDEGLEEIVNHAFDQAQYTTKRLLEQKDKFKMVEESPESLNVCFWYIPESARHLPDGSEKQEILGDVTTKIRKIMQQEGKFLTNYSDLPGLPGHFFRHITCNPSANHQDMDFVLSEIERLGANF